jgi:hypothetical protein
MRRKIIFDGNADDRDARPLFSYSANSDTEMVLNLEPGQLAIASAITSAGRILSDVYEIGKREIFQAAYFVVYMHT